MGTLDSGRSLSLCLSHPKVKDKKIEQGKEDEQVIFPILSVPKFRYFGILVIYLALYDNGDIDYTDSYHTV